MSLNALGDIRRPIQTTPEAQAGAPGVAPTAPNPDAIPDLRQPGSTGARTDTGSAAKALDALSKFIPTEMLAPYVGALSLAVTQGWDATTVYWYFVGATPLVFALFTYAKNALDQRPWPPVVPLIWRAFAATAAFAVWGLSVPTNPLQGAIGGAAVASFLALIVSPVLWAADAIALRLLGTVPTR